MLVLVKGQGLFKASEFARLLWGSRSAPCDYSEICQVAWCVRAVAGLHLYICHPRRLALVSLQLSTLVGGASSVRWLFGGGGDVG